MLARNAEALYWIGRYVERADDPARILDVTVHQLREDSSVDPDHASRILLEVMGKINSCEGVTIRYGRYGTGEEEGRRLMAGLEDSARAR